MELPVEMDGRVRGLLGRHLLSKLGVVVMIRVKKEMGFKPCPFCGSIGFLAVTSEEQYEKMRSIDPNGNGILRVSCEKCNLDFWKNTLCSTPENKGYQSQFESLRSRWNERAQ